MTETYTYDAFGTLTYIQSLNEDGILAKTDTALSCFLYAGEQYDEVSGLYYLRARRYDTTVGRFTQEDTYLGDGRNLYVYVQNNPLKYVDPSGYCSKKEHYGVSEEAIIFEDGEIKEEYKVIADVLINALIIKDKVDRANEAYYDGYWDGILGRNPEGTIPLKKLEEFEDYGLFYSYGRLQGAKASLLMNVVGTAGAGFGTYEAMKATFALTATGDVVLIPEAVALTTEGVVATAAMAGKTGRSAVDVLDASNSFGKEVLENLEDLAIKNIIKKIPKELKTHGKCDGFAKRLAKALDKKGIDYQIIKVESKSWVYSDKAGSEIGWKYHYGIRIGDTVYDNMTPEGMKLQDWLDDLGLSQGIKDLSWRHVEIIQ